MTLTEAQWGRLLLALGNTTANEFVRVVGPDQWHALGWLVVKGHEFAANGEIPRLGDGDRADALLFARLLGLDPETSARTTAQDAASMPVEVSQDWLYDFMDKMTRPEAGL